MSDRALIERLYDRQVCSPAQNACKNDDRLDAAIEALAASEARERTLQRLLERAADWIDALAEGTPDEEESEVFIGEIADALGRASLPDAPAPETGDGR